MGLDVIGKGKGEGEGENMLLILLQSASYHISHGGRTSDGRCPILSRFSGGVRSYFVLNVLRHVEIDFSWKYEILNYKRMKRNSTFCGSKLVTATHVPPKGPKL